MAGKVAWALSRCLPTENADCCMFVNEWVTSLLFKAGSALGFSFGVRVQTEMKIWFIKGLHMLKVVSSEKKLGFEVF